MSFENLERKYIISPKILYFVLSMQFYTLHQFRSLFAKEVFKINEAKLGVYMGLIYFLTFFTNLGIAAINDKFNRPKSLLMTLVVLSAVAFQFFYIQYFLDKGTVTFLVVMFLYMMVNTPIISILDKITLEHLSKIPGLGSKTYGRQRLFGTVGYLTVNLFVEELVKSKTKKNKYDFTLLKGFQLVTTIIAFFSACFLIGQGNAGTTTRQNIRSGFRNLLSNFNYMFFIGIILLNGISRASMTTYLSIFQKHYLKVESYKIPSVIPVFIRYPIEVFNRNPLFAFSVAGVSLEIVIFFFSEPLTATFGLYWPLLFSQVASLIRFMAYYYVSPDTPHVFALSCIFELLKGVNFGFTHMVGVQLAAILCSPEVKATSQMFYSGTFVGLASMVSGFLFERIFKEVSMDDSSVSDGDKKLVYQRFYMINIMLTIAAMIAFVVKYGIVDGSLSLTPWRTHSAEEEKLEKEDNMAAVTGEAKDEKEPIKVEGNV